MNALKSGRKPDRDDTMNTGIVVPRGNVVESVAVKVEPPVYVGQQRATDDTAPAQLNEV
jgi:hypothetical protein